MDDGLAGMKAIQSCGGTCLVQDPDEAEFPGLPLAILNNLEADEVLPVAAMGAALRRITHTAPAGHAVPEAVALEFADDRVAVGGSGGQCAEGEETQGRSEPIARPVLDLGGLGCGGGDVHDYIVTLSS